MGGKCAVFSSAASRICPKWHSAILCSSHLAFSKCCSHTVVLTQIQLRIIPVLFYHCDQISVMVVNLSIVVHALTMHMLTSLSVDEDIANTVCEVVY